MPVNPMTTLSRELARDLGLVLREESFIYVDSIEPDKDRLPVPRFLVLALIDALELADKQLSIYRQLSGDLAAIARGMLAADPSLAALPVVKAAHSILAKIEDFNSR